MKIIALMTIALSLAGCMTASRNYRASVYIHDSKHGEPGSP
jgi:hypothetical protein